jgi:hypothetical protein
VDSCLYTKNKGDFPKEVLIVTLSTHKALGRDRFQFLSCSVVVIFRILIGILLVDFAIPFC